MIPYPWRRLRRQGRGAMNYNYKDGLHTGQRFVMIFRSDRFVVDKVVASTIVITIGGDGCN